MLGSFYYVFRFVLTYVKWNVCALQEQQQTLICSYIFTLSQLVSIDEKSSLKKTLDTSKLIVNSLFYPLVSQMEECPVFFLLILSAIKYIVQQRCLHIETKLYCVNQLSERSGSSKYLAVGTVYFIYIL
jgi:hypothetical protein